jgi:hypothetical protein
MQINQHLLRIAIIHFSFFLLCLTNISHSSEISKANYISNDTVSFVEKSQEVGFLKIITNIDSFLVIVDSNFACIKQSYNNYILKLPVGKRRITISSRFDLDNTFYVKIDNHTLKEYSISFGKNINLYKNSKIYFKYSSYPKLKWGYNLVVISDESTKLYVNKTCIGEHFVKLNVPAGLVNVKALNIYAGTANRDLFVSTYRMSIVEIYVSPIKGIAQGLSILPGLSQYYKNEKKKGLLLLTSILMSFGISQYYNRLYHNSNEDYLELKNDYFNSTSNIDAYRLGNLAQSKYSETKKYADLHNIFFCSGLLLYTYNLLDGLFKKPKSDYRKRLPDIIGYIEAKD